MRGRTAGATPALPLLSAHAHVLRVLLHAPCTRQSVLARLLGLTERSAGRLVQDLTKPTCTARYRRLA